MWQNQSADEDVFPLQSALLLAGAADNGVAGDGCAAVDGEIYVSLLVRRYLDYRCLHYAGHRFWFGLVW